MIVTAYCPCSKCCGKSDGVTASGKKAQKGTIAADWKYYPKGTKLEIPGYGQGTVEDKGGKIKGSKRIDVFFPTHVEAEKWGKQRIQLTIYD